KFEYYDFATNSWSQVDFTKLDFNDEGTYQFLYSMVGAGDEFYCLIPGKNDTLYLCTYSTTSNSWIYVNLLPASFSSGEVLGVREDKLVIGLGFNSGAEGSRNFYQVFPDTGNCGQRLEEMSDETYFGQSGGEYLTSGNTQILVGINDGMAAGAVELFLKKTGLPCKEPTVFDGTSTWTPSATNFFAYDGGTTSDGDGDLGLDRNQIFSGAYGAVDGGFILVGPSRGLNTDDVVDTWVYDVSSDKYASLTDDEGKNLSVDPQRLVAQTATTHDNTFYVMGFSHCYNKLIMKKIALDEHGLTHTDSTTRLARESESPVTNKTAFGGVWLDDESNGLYVKGEDGKLTHTGATEDNFALAFDKDTNTITMKDLELDDLYTERSISFPSAISSIQTLNIKLVGDNKISIPHIDPAPMPINKTCAIYSKQDINISGSGNLQVDSGDRGACSCAISCGGDINFNCSGNLSILAQQFDLRSAALARLLECGVYAMQTHGNVNVLQGSVLAKAGDCNPVYPAEQISTKLHESVAIDCAVLSVCNNAVLDAKCGNVTGSGVCNSIAIRTSNAPLFSECTVTTSVGGAPTPHIDPGHLTTLDYFDVDLSFEDAPATGTLIRAAYTLAPVCAEGFEAKAWFGADEASALEAGQKSLADLGASLDSAYTKVVGSPIVIPPGPDPNPDPIDDDVVGGSPTETGDWYCTLCTTLTCQLVQNISGIFCTIFLVL
ncbi:MAG: hypothetical protein MJ189_03880, partial [Coriobacteriales bacterium]|nr:hypothetical protein [Coriobacteriales bacterium]